MKTSIPYILLIALFARANGVDAAPTQSEKTVTKPNIVYILCDDLGYGDVKSLNPARCKFETPNIDRLCAQGMSFTDCHATASVCTPSRYSILTGRYSWRTRLQESAMPGDAPPLIASGRLTVPELLKRHGYHTAGIGKWHLGLAFGKKMFEDPITDGPLNHGFDYYYGISASADLPPYVYFDNNRFLGVPTVTKDWGTTNWGATGLATEDFDWVDLLPNLGRRAVSYVKERAAIGQPFFLYLPLTSPHTPLLPTSEWKGKSGIGDYGDFVLATDKIVGELTAALDAARIAENTLVIFTSDNGCAPYIDVQAIQAQGHYPSGEFRGYKFDIWEGGHRVPFIVRWPGRVRPHAVNHQLACLSDLLATCADILGETLPEDAGEDSVSLLPALCGANEGHIREALVHHSTKGYFAIRQNNWKLALCSGGGAWAPPSEVELQGMGAPIVQLYDLGTDPGEKKNLSKAHPEIVEHLLELLQKYIDDGRSTPGARQRNDVAVDIWKKPL